jgi:hypothetical protein
VSFDQPEKHDTGCNNSQRWRHRCPSLPQLMDTYPIYRCHLHHVFVNFNPPHLFIVLNDSPVQQLSIPVTLTSLESSATLTDVNASSNTHDQSWFISLWQSYFLLKQAETYVSCMWIWENWDMDKLWEVLNHKKSLFA